MKVLLLLLLLILPHRGISGARFSTLSVTSSFFDAFLNLQYMIKILQQ
jgi:hypothetical protein